MFFLSELDTFLVRQPDLGCGDRLLLAYSGGPDSTALAWGLKQICPDLGIDLQAVHIDHGLDGDSPRRAAIARQLCANLEIPCRIVASTPLRQTQPVESIEMAARRLRYRLLEAERNRCGATFIATAHHADDQIETLLIRLLYGTGIEGLAGIQARQGRLLRPLLNLRRAQIETILKDQDLATVEDPTNYRFDIVRNRVRGLILPGLIDADPEIDDSLLRLALAATTARDAVERRLTASLAPQRTATGVSFSRRALVDLPAVLWPFALALVHRQAGLPYPPSQASRRELRNQLARNARIGCDCGDGWRWEGRGAEIELLRLPAPTPGFAYTVEAPGECEIPELELRFRIRRGAVDSWMFRQSSRRAGLQLPLAIGGCVVVRSRRPGDRVQPFGCRYTRRLKDLLIDRQVPRYLRSRLPLLEVESRLAWVPGVTIDDSCRVEDEHEVWIAELEPL